MAGSRSKRKHRRATMATTIEKLPDHLLFDILIRVPARTLAQMRSVSRPLNALLSEPSFIKSHLHRSIKSDDEILLVFKHLYSFEVTAHRSSSPHLELRNFIQFPYIGLHEFIGAVNGLICLQLVTGNEYFIQIWNPSISALLEPSQISISREYRTSLRFGFDPCNDDYKIVRLSHLPTDVVLVHVYSMRKGCWKLITERFLSYLWRSGEDKVCGDGHDGHLHWLCYHGADHKIETIVAFDLGTERMSEIGLPVDKMGRKNVLGVLGGKLCLMSCLEDHNCEVWLMNEYGNAESWAKHHVFSQFSANNMRPLGFTLSNEFLFATSEVLSMYDPVAAKVKSFMFKVGRGRHAKVVPYVDSLVWITPDKRKRCSGKRMVTTSKS
ncbi:hypothetical protein OSB04_018050 [Centaurea solstitialis]|uniref:F-box domain-containing protein n=1 Tax=Centaurea solstitialis TaxID=347529 RepID=A0AA38TFW2_9ASTR|nr:hypothetical protein OSB04_018050 [Centaurea solstitialis]